MSENTRQFKTRVRRAASYHVVPATGTWGVFTSDGNIVCNFVVDSQTLPEEIHNSIDADCRLTEEGRKFPDGVMDSDYDKELQVGIIMTPQTAENIGQWLIDFVKNNRPATGHGKTEEGVTHES